MAVSDCLPSLVPLAQNVGLAGTSGHFAASTAASSLADRKGESGILHVRVLFYGMLLCLFSFWDGVLFWNLLLKSRDPRITGKLHCHCRLPFGLSDKDRSLPPTCHVPPVSFSPHSSVPFKRLCE